MSKTSRGVKLGSVQLFYVYIMFTLSFTFQIYNIDSSFVCEYGYMSLSEWLTFPVTDNNVNVKCKC